MNTTTATTTATKPTYYETYLRLIKQVRGDKRIDRIFCSAEENAADSAREDGFKPYSEEYYSTLLGSLSSAAEAYEDVAYASKWFARRGYRI
jgi:hypothetical protein